MAYIGNQPSESFTSFATQEFSTSATTSYTLDHAVTNENEIALFINNVRQQPGSGKAYTATGTALTLSAATASTDTMYCVFLGRALQTVTPATNSITAAMVSNDLISGKDALASEPADTDEFLVSDAGTLKRIDYSLIKGGGITVAQQWRLSSNLTCSTTNSATLISSNIEQVDTDGYAGIGSAMSVSSGVFTFPVTGIYLVKVNAEWYDSTSDYCGIQIHTTTDNSSFGEAQDSYAAVPGSGEYANTSGEIIFDVTNTSTHKVKFLYLVHSSTTLSGNTNVSKTYFNFIRLGDT